MRIEGTFEMVKKKDSGKIIVSNGSASNYLTDVFGCTDGEAKLCYNNLRNTKEERRAELYKRYYEHFKKNKEEETQEPEPAPEEEVQEQVSVEDKLARGLNNMINFFKEFNFAPSFRFVNTLVRKGYEAAKSYVLNYFSLMDSPYAEELSHKVDSPEFEGILNDFFVKEPSQHINKRFKVYYGAQGTGKTTRALEETANQCIVCNASMMPADLMEDFTFDDGKATFHPSALARAMEAGTAITLDEINLLPFDSLRFLQGIFDGKTEFLYKGKEIRIADGFKVIGTMNLTINGAVYGLPAPLVDRCEDIVSFELSAESLMAAI